MGPIFPAWPISPVRPFSPETPAREGEKTKLPKRGKENIAVCKVCVELERFDKDISYQYELGR